MSETNTNNFSNNTSTSSSSNNNNNNTSNMPSPPPTTITSPPNSASHEPIPIGIFQKPSSIVPSSTMNFPESFSSVSPGSNSVGPTSASTTHSISIISPLNSPINNNSGFGGGDNTNQNQNISVENDEFDASNSNRSGHVQEQERIIDYDGPNSQYAKLNTILGRGAYKTVWKGLDREEGIEIAWNILETTKNEYSELVQETEILKKVRHPNVIHFYDSWYANGEFVFITELMTSGTLREFIKKFKNPSMKIIKRWARQILKGLHYLHSQSPPIIHRDIKCDNIFINGSHGEVKIGDMGTAKMKFGKKYTVIGTPEFMAPEMYEEKGYNEKVDIYAFGMCLLEMVTGEYPYNECKNAAQIYKKVSQGIKPECLSKVEDKEVLSIILNCIATENERWSARKLLEHPFFAEDPDVSLICVDDSKTKLTFQVVFKGSDKQTVKFDFNTERDTAENVVNEMIEEHILSAKFRQFVTAAIHKILRDLIKNVGAPDETGNNGNSNSKAYPPPAVPPRIIQAPLVNSNNNNNNVSSSTIYHSKHSPINELVSSMGNMSTMSNSSINSSQPLPQLQSQVQGQSQSSQVIFKDKITHQPSGLASTTKKTFGPEVITYDFEPMSRDYPNDFLIEDFVSDVASNCNRDPEKANEWLLKLKNQDIMTVGDLRDLLDDDWAHLQLTVFASRALKNGLQSTPRKHSSSMSPRLSLSTNNASVSVLNASVANVSVNNSTGSTSSASVILPTSPVQTDHELLHQQQ